MDTEGTYDARGTGAERVPRPAGPPPAAPPPPTYAPQPRRPAADGPGVEEWLRTPRPVREPGVWRYGHVPRPPEKPEGVSDRSLLVGVLISVLSGLLLWSLWRNGYIPYRLVPLKLFTPGDWWYAGTFGGPRTIEGADALTVYEAVLFGLLVYGCGRLGNWSEIFRRHVAGRGQPFLGLATAAGGALAELLVWKDAVPLVRPVLILVASVAGGEIYQSQTVVNVIYALIALGVLWPFARLGRWRELAAARRGRAAAVPDAPAGPPDAPTPEQWPELREAGMRDAAEALTAEVRTGRMNDVDVARLRHAWSVGRGHPERLAALTEAVLRTGGAAALHPSGARDLARRTVRHDLLTGQVRIGSCTDDPHNPYARRGSGVALEPALLGTSLLAVGPPGAGKSARLVRPVVESLALQALAGRAAVLAVGGAGGELGPDDAFDVVVRIGDPASVHDFDLYGGTTDPDEAAGVLAEGLVGDVTHLDSRRAATVLAQLLGPYRAVHGHFPGCPRCANSWTATPPRSTRSGRRSARAATSRCSANWRPAPARRAGRGTPDPCSPTASHCSTARRSRRSSPPATRPGPSPFAPSNTCRSVSGSTFPSGRTPRRRGCSPGSSSPSSPPSPPPAPTGRSSSAWSWTTPRTPSPRRPSGASGACGRSTPERS